MTTFASANRKGCLDLWSCHLALKKTEASFAFFTRLIGALDEWLSQRSAKPSTAVRIRQAPHYKVLKPQLTKGFRIFLFPQSSQLKTRSRQLLGKEQAVPRLRTACSFPRSLRLVNAYKKKKTFEISDALFAYNFLGNDYPPKLSYMIDSGSTPRESSMDTTAFDIGPGPHM